MKWVLRDGVPVASVLVVVGILVGPPMLLSDAALEKLVDVAIACWTFAFVVFSAFVAYRVYREIRGTWIDILEEADESDREVKKDPERA
jgi:hypothetical protein